jgi:hypothetical protein
MGRNPIVTRIVIDLRRNELVLELDRPLAMAGDGVATIDIGASGRVLGVEAGDAYLAIADPVPGSESLVRSAISPVTVPAGARRLRVPRKGAGWEISFPSGNQCWRLGADGRTVCSVVDPA